MGLNGLKIGAKLWAYSVLVIVGISLVALLGLMFSNSVAAERQRQQAQSADLLQKITEWAGVTTTNANRTQAVLMADGNVIADTFKEPIAAGTARISELQKSIEAMPLNDAEKAQMAKIAAIRKEVISVRDKARGLKAEGHAEEALQVLHTGYMPASKSYLASLQEMVELQRKQFAQEQEAADQRVSSINTAIWLSVFVVMGLAFACTAWLVRSIRQPLDQANAMAAQIAQGDLSADIATQRTDEFGTLLLSLRSMKDALSRMVAQVRSSTDSIAMASAEIATGNNDLARRTEQTSGNLQATASSMDGLTQTVQQSADNARQASALATSASNVAQRGGEVVNQVVATMQEIDASSKKIADIISVIDGIAFQTNILALNAAVEAARAGEQGRGFAVVASEVRSLAGRSAEAAREIKSLISSSVEKVESGTMLVTDAGATMGEIVQSVQRVADVIGEITAAASEQSSGIAGVNQAIGNLDQMTQQNAALVEESAAAAESLREQADRMKQAVSVFKLSAVSGEHGQVLAPVAVRSSVPRATPFKGPERRGAVNAGPGARASAKPASATASAAQKTAAPKPAAAQSSASAHAAPKTSTRVTPAGGDDDWETF